MTKQKKSIWIPRIPRTGSSYLINILRNAAIEQDWKLFKKDHVPTQVEEYLTDYNCIYTGHNAYYFDKIQNWTKLLVVRRDVIGRFVSCYNFSNYLLDLHNKELVDLDTFIRCHTDWSSPETQQLVSVNRGCWNPYTTTLKYLNFIQSTYDQQSIDDVLDFFDQIYFTDSLDNLTHDLEHVYGYKLSYHSDWVKNEQKIKNSGKDFSHINPVLVSDLTDQQLDSIMDINIIKQEFKFIELLLSELQ